MGYGYEKTRAPVQRSKSKKVKVKVKSSRSALVSLAARAARTGVGREAWEGMGARPGRFRPLDLFFSFPNLHSERTAPQSTPVSTCRAHTWICTDGR